MDGLAELDSKIYYHSEGKLVQVPGLPAMYDYEFFPQEVCSYYFEPTELILNHL